MSAKRLPVAVLLVALAALVGSVAWAVVETRDRGWTMTRLGPGMMGYASTGSVEPARDLGDAKRQAQRFADRLGLRVAEVMRFSNHYYAELVERDGDKATEVLVAPSTGAVWIEYGPAMMWNTRYGMMSDFRLHRGGGMMGSGMMGGGMMGGGMMGGAYGADPTWSPVPSETRQARISAREAEEIADRWLGETRSGLAIGEAEEFPGYYTLHTLRDGRVAGMLSVNATTGAVWYHWWHGRFVSMME